MHSTKKVRIGKSHTTQTTFKTNTSTRFEHTGALTTYFLTLIGTCFVSRLVFLYNSVHIFRYVIDLDCIKEQQAVLDVRWHHRKPAAIKARVGDVAIPCITGLCVGFSPEYPDVSGPPV